MESLGKMNKENAAKSIDLVLNELKKSSFADRFSCTVEINHSWNGKQVFEKKVTRTIACNVSPPITKENKEEIEAIKKKINEAYEADKEAHETLNEFIFSNQLKKGDVLPHFNEKLTDVYLSTPVEIKHQPGEVILLDIWATWCGPCQNPMQHNQDMLQKNGATWGDKVRIIAVSVDDDVNKLKERIEEKKWDKIIHYTTGGWDNDDPLLSNFEVNGIPFVALINKKGIIDFVGHPSELDLESRINELLAQEDAVASESGDKPKQTLEFSQEQVKKLKNIVGKELKSFVETSKEPKDFEIDLGVTLKKETTYTAAGNHTVYSSPQFKSVVQKKQVPNYEILKKKLYSLLGEDITFKKPAEKILDIQRGLKNDIKELAGIINKETNKSVEFEHLVEIKLRLQESFELAKAREDHLLHVSKILIEPTEEAKKLVDTATERCCQYIQQKNRKGEYSDYMFKQLYRGVKSAEKAEDIPAPVPRVNEDVYRKVKEIFEDESLLKEKFEWTLNYNPRLKVVLKRHRIFDSQGNMKEKFYEQPFISYEVKDVDFESFKRDIVDKILDRIGRDLFVVKGKSIKTESVPLGTNCKLCEAVLELPHYYNPFQKEHYCLPCGNKRDETKNTIDSFNVPHNLVFIPSAEPKYLSEIESYKFGKDTQPAPEKITQFEYFFSCNSCQYGSTVCRYICLNCKPGRLQQSGYFDLCHECFDKSMIQKDEQFNKTLKEENETHHENHLFFKIITSEGGYRDF